MQQTFTVTNMSCGHCEMAIRRALNSQDPQAEVAIDRSLSQVVVESELPREELARAITDEGYTVEA
jgi:copper chaperone